LAIESGCSKRFQSPISAHSPSAVSVLLPRKQRNRAIVSPQTQPGAIRSSSRATNSRRANEHVVGVQVVGVGHA
jgi:hypothetical protein